MNQGDLWAPRNWVMRILPLIPVYRTKPELQFLGYENSKQQPGTEGHGMLAYKNMFRVRFQLSYLSQETHILKNSLLIKISPQVAKLFLN